LEKRILELKQVQGELKRSKEFSETVINSINQEITIIDLSDFSIIDANRAVLDRLNIEKEQLLGKKCYEMIHGQNSPCTFPDNICPVLETKKTGIYSVTEHIHSNKDGTNGYIEVSTSPIKNEKGEIIQVVHISKDITVRKLAEKQIMSSLKEKEVLLREIHHRVKNNMQIVSSLLWLQSEYIKDKRDLEIFRDSQNRIMSMSLVHEKLYRSRDLGKIDTKEYITDLTNNIIQSHRVNAGTISLNINIGNISLGVDSAIPCGLIINELITNSLKYAFPDGRKGEIRVSLSPLNENEVELVVGDNGVGIPEDVDFRKTASLGLRLVTILTENQLHGKINLDRSRGTEFNIIFKGVK
jgi:PAS domain S-box-containing protein